MYHNVMMMMMTMFQCLAFPCGLIRGALANLGVVCVVTAEVTMMPACELLSAVFQLRLATLATLSKVLELFSFFKAIFQGRGKSLKTDLVLQSFVIYPKRSFKLLEF